jgi:hypothetical protein
MYSSTLPLLSELYGGEWTSTFGSCFIPGERALIFTEIKLGEPYIRSAHRGKEKISKSQSASHQANSTVTIQTELPNSFCSITPWIYRKYDHTYKHILWKGKAHLSVARN